MTRDALVVGGGLVGVLLLGTLLYVVNTGSIQIPFISETSHGVKVIAQGDTSPLAERKNYKIVSQEQLAEVWGMAYGEQAPAIPEIDFSKKHVLAIFSGSKQTTGFSVSIPSVEDSETVRSVEIVFSEPSKECAVAQVTTSPFVFVEVSASSLPIQKNEITETVPCL